MLGTFFYWISLIGASLSLYAAPAVAATSLTQWGHHVPGKWSVNVRDARGRVVYERAGSRKMSLASVTKTVVADAAYSRYKTTSRFYTRAYGDHKDARGCWKHAWVVGGGDPTWGTNASRSVYGGGVERLARGMGCTRVIYVDDSLFNRIRSTPAGWQNSPDEIGRLGALVSDKGYNVFTHRWAADPAMAAASALAKNIKGKQQIHHMLLPTNGVHRIASTSSPTLSRIIVRTLHKSDNHTAEIILKHIGAGSTKRGAQKLRSRYGISIVDGSGLNPKNQASARKFTSILRLMKPVTLSSFPSGGQGTLKTRLQEIGKRCKAKTGTLNRVSTLAGTCITRSGHKLYFALFNKNLPTYTAHQWQDRFVRLLVKLP